MGAIPPYSFTKVAQDGYSRITMEQTLKADCGLFLAMALDLQQNR